MRNIIATAAATIAVTGMVLGSAATPVFAQGKVYTLKVASFTPKRSATSRWFEKAKIDLAAQSNGRLKLEMYYGSSMGPMPRHYDLARTGVADMAFFQHGVTRGRFPLTELTHSPYLVPPGAKGSLVATQIAADLKDKYLAKEHKGTKLLWVVYNRPSGVYETKKPIRSVADLKGRRYRAPTPTDVAMLKALGALPIGMPATHMAESLQKGTIDGVVTDPMGVFSFKLGSLVNHYTNMFVSVISFGLVMNPKSYANLPPDLQKMIDALGTKESAVRMATMSWSDFPAFTKYMGNLKLETVQMSASAEAEMRSLAKKVMNDRIAGMEKKGLPARKVYGEMKVLAAKYSK
ncbi:MAG: TRAP transporter substrate-binding protein DctP [Proteobacteria bacterium]|nr:TRAP transporter substrate-binding protein DctP [Pseudomonadota bacterium]MDA1323126.1 TRAP transporter substrate-binding protein DctP [Pseudomonadota bacterium]